MSDNPASEETPHLLALPAELREQIYQLILSPAANRIAGPDEYDTYGYGAALALFLVSRQVYYEARAVFRALNVFVKIQTPWPEAQDHVEVEGHVPILLKGRRAVRFGAHTLAVAIDAPLMGGSHYGGATGGAEGEDAADFSNSSDNDSDNGGDDAGVAGTAESRGGRGAGRSSHWAHRRAQTFVILLDDLPKFTRTWFYSELSNPGLNRYLDLRLQVRDPHPLPRTAEDGDGEDEKKKNKLTEEMSEQKEIPEPLVRRLLLPFGEVKNLARLTVSGNLASLASIANVEDELRELQAVPPATPEQCLAEAARLKAEGNALLTTGNPRGALEVYARAWEAIHIVVRGRQRHVHAEAYFARQLGRGGGVAAGGGSASSSHYGDYTEGVEDDDVGDGEEGGDEPGDNPWRGRNGAMERLVLRVQLVANTCLAYLKLGLWEEVCFWGMRSIGMMRQARLAGPMNAGGGMVDIDMDMDVRPEDEAILGFPGAIQMGKIYYRTALGFKELDDKTRARKLLRVAHVYLPRDENVRRELAACALRLG